jgi:uncharacterized membrane protein
MKIIKRFPQIILGLALGYAGIGHLTTSRQEFQAQVPNLLKDYADFVVVASGVVEIVLGLALVALWSTGAWQARKKKKSVVTERDDLEEDTIYG